MELNEIKEDWKIHRREIESNMEMDGEDVEGIYLMGIEDVEQVEWLIGQIEQLKSEKEKWFNAYHNQIMKPF
jgi:hypothetical protein